MLEILLYAGRAIMPLLLTMALGCWLRHSAHWSDDFYRQLNSFCFHVLLPVQLFLNVYAIEDLSVLNWRLLGFIESEPYQVVTMGHSCGNPDRTLLNTLLEHPNCISVKVYYHQHEDGTDDYSQLIRNLSRNFNDKAALRDKVVHKERCAPLVPVVVQK